MRFKPIIYAAVFVLAVVAWFASGMLGEVEAPQAQPPAARAPERMLVEAQILEAAPVTRFIVSQGEVRPFRELTLRAETAGPIEEILVEKGARVDAGDMVARIALGERESRLEEARAALAGAEADYDAQTRLAERGFATEQRGRELFAQLQAERAAVQRIEEEIADTEITAPFAGIVNALPVEEGQFVSVGGEIATLIDNDPLLVSIQVPQQNVAQVKEGAPAMVAFVTGQEAMGDIAFVSANADRATRSFEVEIRVANPGSVPSGISAETRIPTARTLAHFLSPALLSLDKDGTLGVKTVDEDGTVQFYPIDLVRAEADGIWVSGLPERIRLITVGQGFVQAGEQVDFVIDETFEPPPPPDDGAPELFAPGVAARSDENAAAEISPKQQPIPEMRAEAPAAVPTRAPAPREPEPEPLAELEVDELQQALNRLGYAAGPADGRLGPQTRAAIRAFQSDVGLPPTGELSAALIESLADALGVAEAESRR